METFVFQTMFAKGQHDRRSSICSKWDGRLLRPQTPEHNLWHSHDFVAEAKCIHKFAVNNSSQVRQIISRHKVRFLIPLRDAAATSKF